MEVKLRGSYIMTTDAKQIQQEMLHSVPRNASIVKGSAHES